VSALDSLPWRGPGEGRPEDLPLPPGRMPLRFGGATRKRWRYVAAFCDELMLCAARVRVGPVGQTFWAIWDRERGELLERTVTRLPGSRGQVWTEDEAGLGAEHAPDEGSKVRIEATHPQAGSVRGFLRFGGGAWVEAVCPAGDDAFVWTRKRAGVPVSCDVRIGDRRLEADALGVEDESAGYHPRHTVWSWSAGVGELDDGRPVAWNLVSGVNDPSERSERAVWVAGEPSEPGPVAFDGLDSVGFADGARLVFSGECERRRSEERLVLRYTYRQPFGTFAGTLPGGLRLARGMGVMEHHDATW
jgi:hypothetical protein